jgi:hypothetical protein
MPSWAPQSMNEVRRVTVSARFAAASPASAWAVNAERSTAMKANSWATKYALAVNATAAVRVPSGASPATIS